MGVLTVYTVSCVLLVSYVRAASVVDAEAAPVDTDKGATRLDDQWRLGTVAYVATLVARHKHCQVRVCVFMLKWMFS